MTSNNMKNRYSDVGKDEKGNVIANCNLCGANGVLVRRHNKECEKVKESSNEPVQTSSEK